MNRLASVLITSLFLSLATAEEQLYDVVWEWSKCVNMTESQDFSVVMNYGSSWASKCMAANVLPPYQDGFIEMTYQSENYAHGLRYIGFHNEATMASWQPHYAMYHNANGIHGYMPTFVNIGISVQPSHKVRFGREGENLVVYHNGTLKRTIPYTSANPLYIAVSFYMPGIGLRQGELKSSFPVLSGPIVSEPPPPPPIPESFAKDWSFTQNGSNFGDPIYTSGKVGIGVSDPQDALSVKGAISTEELKIKVDGGADYVFEDNYALMPIKELKQYIRQNKHLPGIPSASKMHANGLEVSEMMINLLAKIEELTLYNFQLRDEIDSLKAEIK